MAELAIINYRDAYSEVLKVFIPTLHAADCLRRLIQGVVCRWPIVWESNWEIIA